MKVRLIATDLDGTLIPYGKAIPEPVLDALQEALDQGIFVCLLYTSAPAWGVD